MDTPLISPLEMVRDLMATVDDTVQNVTDAHGFSFLALSVDSEAVVMRFATKATEPAAVWQLTFHRPAQGYPAVLLKRGSEAAPSVTLSLTIDGQSIASLAAGLGIAIEVFAAISQ